MCRLASEAVKRGLLALIQEQCQCMVDAKGYARVAQILADHPSYVIEVCWQAFRGCEERNVSTGALTESGFVPEPWSQWAADSLTAITRGVFDRNSVELRRALAAMFVGLPSLTDDDLWSSRRAQDQDGIAPHTGRSLGSHSKLDWLPKVDLSAAAPSTPVFDQWRALLGEWEEWTRDSDVLREAVFEVQAVHMT